MDKKLSESNTCKNVFKKQSAEERVSEFNRKWIELINRMERQQSVAAACQK